MSKIPINLELSPIEETIFEIRFSSNLPDDAVFGVFYNALLPICKMYKLLPLPISQLPKEVRDNDPNLKYQPLYNLEKDEVSIAIGSHTIVFTNKKPYKGWKIFKDFIFKAFDLILSTKSISSIERLGLRYINVIEPSLFDATNIKLELGAFYSYKNSLSTIYSEFMLPDGIKAILRMNDKVSVSIGGKSPKIASMIDIDVLHESLTLQQNENLIKDIEEYIEAMHTHEKELFFSILKEDFISELKPVY